MTNEASVKSPYQPLVTVAVIGAIFYTLDALVLGQGALIVLVTLIGMLLSMVRIASALGRRAGRDAAIHTAAFALWIGFTVGTVASVYAQARLSKSRAETVVAACKAYHSDHGRYPERLEDLVPAYLPKVPRARLAMTADRFQYFETSVRDGQHTTMLMYTTIPPFGRTTYWFEQDRWSSLD